VSLEDHIREHLTRLCDTYPDRHVGGPGNRDATEYFAQRVAAWGFGVSVAELDCVEWESGASELRVGGEAFALHTGPYSLPLDAVAPLAAVSSVDELEAGEFSGSVLLVHGALAAEQLMPKEFVFYNPASHRRIVAALERQSPVAVIAATGRNPELAGGAYPFPLIEDGDFDIPNAYLTDVEGERLLSAVGEQVSVRIDSRRIPASAQHVVATLPGSGDGRIVFFAHIDSKDGTPGALDNATGVAVLLGVAELLREYRGPHTIELVPLNGEDYYATTGQTRYLADNTGRLGDIVVGCNVDGAGFLGAQTEASLYSVPDAVEAAARAAMRDTGVAEGPQWVQGDHSLFIMNGVPAIAVTSADVFFNVSTVAHTPADTIELVDPAAVATAARFFANLVAGLS
jgi:aminopeptidase YwaD